MVFRSQLIAPDIVLTAGHCAYHIHEIRLGMHNIIYHNNSFESYLIEDSVLHPRAKANKDTKDGNTQSDPFTDDDGLYLDEYDFFLIKIYGRSEAQPITLNSDPFVPHATGNELLVMGWGTVNPNETNVVSPVLREAVLEYMTNEECLMIKGMATNGIFFDYEKYIIPVSMCASSFDNKDACAGDSGGPLMSKPTSNDASQDVQVGVVSFGVDGCGHPGIPGVYARVSYIAPWIQESVCRMSNDPPSQFGCPEKLNKPDFSGDLVEINIQIGFDKFPEQNGWIIQSENKSGALATYAVQPVFSFADLAPEEIIIKSIQLPNNRQYTITMLDRIGDGMCCGYNGFGNLTIVEGSILNSSKVLIKATLLEFTYSESFTFILGNLPTPAPTVTAVPSTTTMPSSVPTVSRAFVSIEINFDNNPAQSGWDLEALGPNDVPILIATRYAGVYANESAGSIFVERINLLPTHEPTTYRFRATDTDYNGICCDNGFGYYKVWYGEVDTGVVVAEVDRFYIEKYVNFLVESTELGSTSPSISPSSSFLQPFLKISVVALSVITIILL